MQGKRVLLIDDHALFRTGMKLILTQVGQVDHVTEANTIKEAFALTKAKLRYYFARYTNARFKWN